MNGLDKVIIKSKKSAVIIDGCERGQFTREFCLGWLKDNGYTEIFTRYIMARRGGR